MSELSISTAQLFDVLGTPNAPRVIDLRDADDRASDPTRIPGADLVFLDDLDAALPALPIRRRIVVICQKGGKLSQIGAGMLRQHGHDAVNQDGGYLSWRAANLPIQSQASLASLWYVPTDPTVTEFASLWLLRRWLAPDVTVLPIDRGWIAKALDTRSGSSLVDVSPTQLADQAGLRHPDMMANLSSPIPERMLRGRLRQSQDPLRALDLMDDWMRGASV